MARAVYSKCFLSFGYPTLTDTYVITPGDTGIVHDMTFWSNGSYQVLGSDALTVALDNDAAFIWTIGAPKVAKGVYRWQGRQVFTDFITVTGWNLVPWWVRICGYVLTPT